MPALLTQTNPPSLFLAQAIGLTASGYLLGQNAGLSLNAVPAIMQAPAPLAAKQWFTILTNGGFYGKPLAIASGLATAYTAYHQDPTSLPFTLNLAATFLIPGIVPFTLLFIAPLNKRLEARMHELSAASVEDANAVEAKFKQEETTHAMIDRWGVLNLARAGLIALGVGCVVVAALEKGDVVVA